MGNPLKISLACLILLITKANCQRIEASDNEDVNFEPVDASSFLVSMNENNHEFDNGLKPHTQLFKIVDVSASPTVSFNGVSFSYTIEKDEEIDRTYLFYANQSFDYETQAHSYIFNIIVDGTYPIIALSIVNIDDESPSLTSPQCEFEENTIYTAENSTCDCIVSDPDGWLGNTTFEITLIAGGDEAIFSLEFREIPKADAYNAPVYVTVNKQLNYQEVTFYLFDIKAEDGAHHSTIPNELVRAMVNVIDLPDTPPEWINYFTFQQFEEQTERTYSVTAIDGDHGCNYEINYDKLWEDDEEANYISIDNNGTINVKKIDRDKNDISVYKFQIIAYEVPNARLWNNTLEISFYILDIDNNPPLITWIIDNTNQNISYDDTTNKETKLSFLENYSGNLNLTIFIRDIDTGENAQFTVELEDLEDSSEQYSEAFLIVPTAGYRSGTFQISVQNADNLDYEKPAWRNIKFTVLTRGFLNSTKEDRMLVDITLIDYNDEIPIFDATQYEKDILETEKEGEFIIQILATDADEEDKILSHTLIGSTYTHTVLRIEEDTGKIFVNAVNAFDYDTVNPIFVQVRATDKVGHIATVPLTITLLDVNNKAPTISVGDPINVDENQITNTKLTSYITATDVDTTALLSADINWERSYAMKNSRRLDMTNETISKQVKFLDINYHRSNEADETNKDIVIELIVNGNNKNETTPDFELFDSLYLSVVVTDSNTDPDFLINQQTSALILISINDINDNTPFFPEANQPKRENRTVQDEASQGISVGSIVAIDLDVDDTVTYACKAEDPNFDWVDVNTNTGAFTVKDDNLVDADTHKTFYFNYSCTASDTNFTHTSEALTVQFYIIDVNNKRPVITIDDDVYVLEKSPPNTKVSDIGTKDDDRDIPFHTVACSFRDRDTPCYESFIIDNNVVRVRTGYEDINRDEGQALYSNCIIVCQDNPDRLQSDQRYNSVEQTFTIHLVDINDHTPEVLTKNLAISENTLENELIGIILATDIDADDNAEIVFNISKVINIANEEIISNLFNIEIDDYYRVNLTHKQANLVTLQDLSGKYGTYLITIGVADKGDPPNSKFYDVTLDVEKFNFEAPRFIFPSTDNYPIILLTAQQQNSQLVLFRRENSQYLQNFYASDNSESNICNKWDMQFNFEQISPEENTIFTIIKIDACSGQLQVNNNYNQDSILGITYNLQLTVRVKDGVPQEGEAPYTSQRSVVINFLDNNQKPVFNVREWSINFLEEDSTLTQELEYRASYEVEDPSLPIYYFLVTSDETIANLFAVDEDTGVISLKDKLDYETNHFFKFQIVASNDSSPTSNNPNSYLDVTCYVIDINDNVPQWKKDFFFGALMSSYIRGTPILTIEATDADEIDKNKLTYFMNGTINKSGFGLDNVPSDAFLVSETTGEIRLNFQVDTTMSGYFNFDVTVWDVEDQYGNGPHWNTAKVTIFIITTDNTVIFRFYNTIEEVQNEEQTMLEVVTDVLGYDAYSQSIDKEKQNGVDLDNITIANLYFVNNSSIQAIEADTILRLVSNINIFSQLVGALRNQTGLILWSFPSNNASTENLEQVLKAWLVGVSVVLGALCLILLVTFILKTRELNNRITNLTMRKFGSQESGLNRLGISAPTTNKHAIEGSNPIFNINNNDVKKDRTDFDEVSMRSGDSDLIGIEDNPEFDYLDKKLNESSQYI